jgi:hypothetical protein
VLANVSPNWEKRSHWRRSQPSTVVAQALFRIPSEINDALSEKGTGYCHCARSMYVGDELKGTIRYLYPQKTIVNRRMEDILNLQSRTLE